jgi:hypothetical protein
LCDTVTQSHSDAVSIHALWYEMAVNDDYPKTDLDGNMLTTDYVKSLFVREVETYTIEVGNPEP